MSDAEDLVYKDVPEWTRERALEVLAAGNPGEIVYALLALAFNDPDHVFVEKICAQHARHSAENVRAMAIECFEHIARIHRALDPDSIALVQAALSDPDEWVRSNAEDARSHIRIYLGESAMM